MITCNNLTIRYGNTVAVDQLNMVTQKGEKVSVVGASGCGKTSLLHGMAGLLKPASGEVTVHGEKVEDIRQGTAIILQQDGLFPWKNVHDNVCIALLSQNKGEGILQRSEVEKRVNLVLDELVESSKQVSDYVAEIAAASRQQSEGIAQINQALIQMDQIAQKNTMVVEDATRASSSLGEEAKKLNHLVEYFQLNSESDIKKQVRSPSLELWQNPPDTNVLSYSQ